MTFSLCICQSRSGRQSKWKLPCGLTRWLNNSFQRQLSHHLKVFATDCAALGLLQPHHSQHVKQGEKVSGVKVPQMLCPRKLQPAGRKEVRPRMVWVRTEGGYVRQQQCSCLITLESITNSLSQERSRLDPAGHRWQREAKLASVLSQAHVRHR